MKSTLKFKESYDNLNFKMKTTENIKNKNDQWTNLAVT